ncbi:MULTISPECIES: type VI secretion system tube protein Hcp [unclassified Caballeronia]|uniref:Hcp family type VI secretion system effector n=1 Tax=unclassified Caballeronia TaxID=2646786 RepID=UPI0028622F38|nr:MULTISPECIES: type VI secretion system tube protein Hcp [unclassified Caballeronia]MDR5739328.1 type VI secretion system tube protein Hcp [Caballeronia sp. LZ016]MDR5807817.1 type VI secretion system tube protein Hcp [Caballeronia sp. LZ019]
MSSDILLQIKGITGESQDVSLEGAIEVIHWELCIEQQSSMLSGSGGGAGKASVSDLTFRHELDRASPNLAVYAAQGKRISEAKLIMRKSGGLPLEYYRITLYDVLVTKVWPSVDGASSIETVSLSFARMKQEYVLQSKRGASAGTITGIIDVKQNRAA